jgi:hypothetical protein
VEVAAEEVSILEAEADAVSLVVTAEEDATTVPEEASVVEAKVAVLDEADATTEVDTEVSTAVDDCAAVEETLVASVAVVLAAVEVEVSVVLSGLMEMVHVFTCCTAGFPFSSVVGVNTITQVSVITPAAVSVVWTVVICVGSVI